MPCHAHVAFLVLFNALFHDNIIRVYNLNHCCRPKNDVKIVADDGEEDVNAGPGGDGGDYGRVRVSEDEHGRENGSLHAGDITVLKHAKADVEEKDIFHVLFHVHASLDLNHGPYSGLFLALKVIMTCLSY